MVEMYVEKRGGRCRGVGVVGLLRKGIAVLRLGIWMGMEVNGWTRLSYI